jgi:hypothetical protein
MREIFLDALHDKYIAQISEAKAKATVYLDNSVGIGDHSQFIEELDKLINVLDPKINAEFVKKQTEELNGKK